MEGLRFLLLDFVFRQVCPVLECMWLRIVIASRYPTDLPPRLYHLACCHQRAGGMIGNSISASASDLRKPICESKRAIPLRGSSRPLRAYTVAAMGRDLAGQLATRQKVDWNVDRDSALAPNPKHRQWNAPHPSCSAQFPRFPTEH